MTAQAKHQPAGGTARRSRRAAAEPPAPPPLGGGGHGGGTVHDLYSTPEFLFRRAHQIASAAFVEACRHLDLTPSQFAALLMLRQAGEVSQNELGRLIALDRSTTSVVQRSLRERRLVKESADPADRRKKRLRLTDTGRLLLAEAERLSSSSSRNLLGPLGPAKARQLLALLEELSAASAPDEDGAA